MDEEPPVENLVENLVETDVEEEVNPTFNIVGNFLGIATGILAQQDKETLSEIERLLEENREINDLKLNELKTEIITRLNEFDLRLTTVEIKNGITTNEYKKMLATIDTREQIKTMQRKLADTTNVFCLLIIIIMAMILL
jgi:hypothetical protein